MLFSLVWVRKEELGLGNRLRCISLPPCCPMLQTAAVQSPAPSVSFTPMSSPFPLPDTLVASGPSHLLTPNVKLLGPSWRKINESLLFLLETVQGDRMALQSGSLGISYLKVTCICPRPYGGSQALCPPPWPKPQAQVFGLMSPIRLFREHVRTRVCSQDVERVPWKGLLGVEAQAAATSAVQEATLWLFSAHSCAGMSAS